MKFTLEYKEKLYDCEWSDETNFEDLENVTGVCGFIFNDDKELCIVNFKDKPAWSLPGGGVEDDDETFEHTMIRETEEEADLDLKDLQRLGYVKVVPQDKEEKIHHQLRFVSKIDKIKEQTIDPAEGYIPERRFIHPGKFIEHAKWEKNGEHQLNQAIKKLRYKKTKSVGAIIHHENKFLITKKTESHGGHWDFPKGGINKNETDELEALHREIKEETNLEIELLPNFYEELHYEYSDDYYDYDKTVGYYLATPKTFDAKSNDTDEIEQCLWATKEEIYKKINFEDSLAIFEKALASL